MVNLTNPTASTPANSPTKETVDKPLSRHEVAVEGELLMPHERDETVSMTDTEPDPVIKQAATDLGRGLQDTSNGAEFNRAYKKLK